MRRVTTQEYAPMREVRATADVPWLGMHILHKSCSGAVSFMMHWRQAQASCTGDRHRFFQRGFGPAFFVGSFSAWACAKGALHDLAEATPKTLPKTLPKTSAETLAETRAETWKETRKDNRAETQADDQAKQAGRCGCAPSVCAAAKCGPAWCGPARCGPRVSFLWRRRQ